MNLGFLDRLTNAPPWMRGVAAFLGLAWPAQWRWIRRKLVETVLRRRRIETPDRSLLEGWLLPRFAAREQPQSLLFVGCEAYTRDYEAMFEETSTCFHTIEIDPGKARFGAKRHVIAPLQEVAEHFEPASLDVVVCNGVYGFGLNDRAGLEAALRGCAAVLKPGGELILGWNNVKPYGPFDPSEVALAAGFVHGDALPSAAWRHETDTPTRHTFDSYRRSSR